MNRTKRLLCTAAMMAAPFVANAATVTPQESVFFSFDTTALGAFEITGSAFACLFSSECFEDDGLLAPGADLFVDYGTTPGGTDLGSRSYANSFATPINNAAGNVATSPAVLVPAEVEALYATFGYSDDVYSVEEFQIFTTAGTLSGSAPTTVPLAAAPLSATGWMLLVGLCAFGAAGQTSRKKRAPARA